MMWKVQKQKYIDFDSVIGNKVMIINEGIEN